MAACTRSIRTNRFLILVGTIVAIFLAAPSAQAAPLRYVALGDSYSAASGVLPVDLLAPQCLRSIRNYPHVIAGKKPGTGNGGSTVAK